MPQMEHSLKSTPVFKGKLNREDTPNGVHYKENCKVDLRAILNSVQLYQ